MKIYLHILSLMIWSAAIHPMSREEQRIEVPNFGTGILTPGLLILRHAKSPANRQDMWELIHNFCATFFAHTTNTESTTVVVEYQDRNKLPPCCDCLGAGNPVPPLPARALIRVPPNFLREAQAPNI